MRNLRWCLVNKVSTSLQYRFQIIGLGSDLHGTARLTEPCARAIRRYGRRLKSTLRGQDRRSSIKLRREDGGLSCNLPGGMHLRIGLRYTAQCICYRVPLVTQRLRVQLWKHGPSLPSPSRAEACGNSVGLFCSGRIAPASTIWRRVRLTALF
jgi:hypothetical protein